MALANASDTSLVSRRKFLGFLGALAIRNNQELPDSIPSPRFKIGQAVTVQWWDGDEECWQYGGGSIRGCNYQPDHYLIPVGWTYHVWVTHCDADPALVHSSTEFIESEIKAF
jgi:hypothetical protein